MSIIGSNILAGAAGSGVSAYEIEQSLRFDGSSTKLSRTPSSSGSGGTLTISYWAKHVTGQSGMVLESWLDANNWSATAFAADVIGCQVRAGGTYTGRASNTVTQLARDPSAWYHVVWSQTGGTQNVYINGVLASTFTSVGTTSFNTSGRPNTIGARSINSEYFAGYLAEMHLLDGTAAGDPDGVFGEFDDNGIWRPIEYTGGNYGTNGFYMKFDPTATNGIGHDHSGNGNNFTATGFTTSGTGTDVMSDTPTTNWCTLNPIGSSATGGFSEGNLSYLNGTTAVWRSAVSTFAVSSGKWYFEAKFTTIPAGSRAFVGVGPDTVQWVNNLSHFGQGSASGSYGYYNDNGNIYLNGSGSSYGATYTTNDVIGVALDLDAGTLHFYKNGVDQGQAASGLTGTWNFGVSSLDRQAVVNFGQRAFEQTPPTGFKALNTSNLPAPDIADGSDYFDTFLYNGTNSSSASNKTGDFTWTPDFVWIKNRNGANSHRLVDAVRGTGISLISNSTGAEVNSTTYAPTAFISGGYTTQTSDNSINGLTSDTYVAWNWLAANGTSSNTAGSITSTVSANPTAGFSIITYTGNRTSGATVGHGLGVAPSMVIVKNKDSGAQPWRVYHSGLGATKALRLNDTTAAETDTAYWNDTTPSSTVVTLGNDNSTNATGDNYVAYCFAEVEGYSKFGSYTGNGSTDGPFVYCGLKPAWLMIKRTDSTNNWFIYDSVRDEYNVCDKKLEADNSNAEAEDTNNELDILSNGFKLRRTQNGTNGSGFDYIFIAFASNPFGGDGVSPATAR